MGFARQATAIVLVLFCFASTLLADLHSDIRQVLANRLLQNATVGIEIVRLTEDPSKCQVMYELNARTPLIPASNMKLLTTSAALHVLSPQFRYRTMLVRRGDDLIIWGDGDPTLGDAELMDKIGWSQLAVFEEWAKQLKNRQITTVRNIIVDDSIFDEELEHPRWKRHQFKTYAPQIGGLNFATNLIEFTVTERRNGPAAWSVKPMTEYVTVGTNTCVSGPKSSVTIGRNHESNAFFLRGQISGTEIYSLTIHDPGMYAGSVFRDLLRREGITVTGSVLRDRQTRQQHAAANPLTRDQEWQILCIFETPITTVIAQCNKHSHNMYAESLAKRMGAAAANSGSWRGAALVMGEYLKKLGVAENEFRIDDGSGLSAENAVSPNALVRTLLHNFYSPNRTVFMETLPVGGMDGTLKNRFSGQLRGRVFAKTGFIANVSSLSGYLKTRNGEWYAFVILMNGIPDYSNNSIKPLQERIVEAIDDAASMN